MSDSEGSAIDNRRPGSLTTEGGHTSDSGWLAERFEENRAHLRAVAYRMLGSRSEAEDAVQEAWLKLERADRASVENLGGWLTTVVARVCLDMLRTRKSRREEPLGVRALDEPPAAALDPEREALLADSVGPALLVVLETLAPAERLAFVLHDMFAVSFDEIAAIVGRSATAARQLASRARRRVQGAGDAPEVDPERQRQVVAAFLAAARNGDFDALMALLDPEVVVRADAAAVRIGAAAAVHGATAVANVFKGRAQGARLALVDGRAGALWALRGRPRVVFIFKLSDGKISEVELVAGPEHLGRLDLLALEA